MTYNLLGKNIKFDLSVNEVLEVFTKFLIYLFHLLQECLLQTLYYIYSIKHNQQNQHSKSTSLLIDECILKS